MQDVPEAIDPQSGEVEALFRTAGVLREGHFVLTSGLHSPVYWEKFRILQYPQYTGVLCRMIAERFRGESPSVVVGPTTGGVILAFETARQLGVRGIFAEKEGNLRVLRRDFVHRAGGEGAGGRRRPDYREVCPGDPGCGAARGWQM